MERTGGNTPWAFDHGQETFQPDVVPVRRDSCQGPDLVELTRIRCMRACPEDTSGWDLCCKVFFFLTSLFNTRRGLINSLHILRLPCDLS